MSLFSALLLNDYSDRVFELDCFSRSCDGSVAEDAEMDRPRRPDTTFFQNVMVRNRHMSHLASVVLHQDPCYC